MQNLADFFFDLENPMTQVSDFDPKSDDLGYEKNGMVSKFKTFYPRQQAAAERSMSWMVTQRYSDVSSRLTRGRRAARLSVATLQTAGAGRA